MLRIQVRERGKIARGMRSAYNRAAKDAWRETAEYFHANLRDKRFTEAHAREAGYYKRKGEGMPRGSKGFRRSYTGRKLRQYGHTRPLEFSGTTRAAIATRKRITSTSKGGRIAYAGASAFNFRHPKSRIRMGEEFRRITEAESVELARVFDQYLDVYLAELD